MSRVALVVEDDIGMLMIYNRVLSSIGYEVIEAHNGAVALDFLEERIPDIMFLDVLMPEVSGLEVMRHIAEEPRLHAMRLIVASSNGKFQKEANELPNAEFILKPLRPAMIRYLAE